VNPRVRFEDEAEAEYRAAGRWYEERRVGLGLEFLDAVDTTIHQIVKLPHARAPVRGLTPDLLVRHAPVKRGNWRYVANRTRDDRSSAHKTIAAAANRFASDPSTSKVMKPIAGPALGHWRPHVLQISGQNAVESAVRL